MASPINEKEECLCASNEEAFILKNITSGFLNKVFDAVVKSESLVPIQITRSEQMLIAGLRPVRIVADEQDTPNNFTIFTASNYDQTSGSIDENAFHYLMTRGLSRKESIKLLINGFLNEIISEIKSTSIRKFVENKTELQIHGY